MARNNPFDGPEYEGVFWVDALGIQQEKYLFNSAKTFIFEYKDNEPTPTYSGADSCYGRIENFSCKPGDNDSINYSKKLENFSRRFLTII